MSDRTDSVDIVTAEIVRNGMTAAALEMARTFGRTAYNPLLYESQDYGLGIISADGMLWGEAPGVAVFVGCLGDTIKTGLEKLGPGAIDPGDVVIVNDPYLTGTHISDTTVYLPIFHDEVLIAFSVATAHWADIGGKSPGGWCPDSTDVYQEGICFSHEKLIAAGEPNAALWSVIENNVRYPGVVLGDLEAMIASCRQGAERVLALCERYGGAVVTTAMEESIARTDEAIRARIAEIPDGTYEASMQMDDDGVAIGEPFTVAVRVRVAGERIGVSFEGSSETRGGPVNLAPIGTRSSVRSALKGLLWPTDPTNEGHFLAFDVDLTPGLVVTPARPAPVDSYGYVVVAVIELTMRALSQVMPERVPAGGFQLFAVFLFRVDPRKGSPFLCIDPLDGGAGGRPHEDAPSLNCLGNGDVPNTPVEVTENRYPLRVERLELMPGAAGNGKFRGGLGVRRDWRVLEPGTMLQVATDNTVYRMGKGLGEGTDGASSHVVVRPGAEDEEVLRRRVGFYGPLGVSDLISARSAGGGGWGSPLERDPEMVARDVRDELLPSADAADVHGVVLVDVDGSAELRVDVEATAALRTRRAAEVA